MESTHLTPPFDRNLLPLIDRGAADRNLMDVSDTVAWLIEHDNANVMKTALLEAWASCSLPMHNWARNVSTVRAITNDSLSYLGLEIVVNQVRPHTIVQQAPLGSTGRAQFAESVDKTAVPPIVWELAAAAPGLCLEDTGYLAAPTSFRHPLRYVRHRLTPGQDAACAGDPYEELRRELPRFVMELGSDNLGNHFLLGRDRRLYFFDFAEPAFQACDASVEDFIRTYCERPQCVFDSEFLGIH